MQKNKNSLAEWSVIRSLFTLSIPIIFAQILQSAYQFTDSFWVGRLGGAAVAAVSVSFPVTFLMIALGAGFSVAGSILIAQYFWAKNEKMVNHVAAQTLLMVLIVSSVLWAIGFILTPSILHMMDIETDVYNGALGFMRVSFAGMIFSFGFMMFQSVMRGIGQVTMPLYIVGGTVLLNFILDPLFIFWYGSFQGMGVMGAALATFGTQSLATIIGFVILLRGKYGIHLKLHDFRPDFAFIKRSFLLGFPASIEMSGRALGLTVMTFLLATFGTLAVASYGVGSTIIQFVMIFCMGLSMAISTLVWQNIGAGNIDRASETAKIGAWVSFLLMTGVGVIIFLLAPQLITIFIPNDPAVVTSGVVFLRIIALSSGFMGIQFALVGVFRASGNMVATMIITLISQWILQLPLAYILSRFTPLGIVGFWWAFPITNIITALGTIVWFMWGTWKNKRITEEKILTEHVTEEMILEEGVH